jgi:MoaA/NifB/PqqE/SkfB family radical SAM enzyme
LFCPFFGNENKRPQRRLKSQKSEMTTGEAKYAISQLKNLGIVYLAISGVEPLLRKDLKELAQFACKKNMVTALTTNGTLVTKELAQSLNGCFETITVSIHGLEDVDDKIKGQKGAFKKSVNGLKLLKKYSGSRIGINFVINKYNYHQIEDIFSLAKENCDFINYLPVNFYSHFFLEEDAAKMVENKLIELKEKNKKFIPATKSHTQLFAKHLEGKNTPNKCAAFDLSVSLSPTGELGGCCYPFTVGNILKTDAKTLLKLGRSRKRELRKRCGGSVITTCEQWSTVFDQPMSKNFQKIWGILKRLRKV